MTQLLSQDSFNADKTKTFQPNEVLLVIGLWLTFQPAVGVDDHEVATWIQEGVERDEPRHALTAK